MSTDAKRSSMVVQATPVKSRKGKQKERPMQKDHLCWTDNCSANFLIGRGQVLIVTLGPSNGYVEGPRCWYSNNTYSPMPKEHHSTIRPFLCSIGTEEVG